MKSERERTTWEREEAMRKAEEARARRRRRRSKVAAEGEVLQEGQMVMVEVKMLWDAPPAWEADGWRLNCLEEEGIVEDRRFQLPSRLLICLLC